MKELEYPFDAEYILKKRKRIKRELLENDGGGIVKRIHKRIAILGGSTTHDIKEILELFLLNYGIEAEFYESEYNQYWQDIMFDNPELIHFDPEIVYIHTTSRNISSFPKINDPPETVEALEQQVYRPFEEMWDKIYRMFQCTIIQNNFEPYYYRFLGNKDVSDIHGRLHFINALNDRFYKYAQEHDRFYIHDINYLASCYGLQKWSDPLSWHMYKVAVALPAVPEFAFDLANIIKSIYGRNKKALVLDLDNTLWGGIVGDDGPDKIEVGQETPTGQLYSEFQSYIKAYKDIGVLLTVNSKNDEENALAGLARPDSVLKPDDFAVIKANWLPKDKNLEDIAGELNIGLDSLVFVDDNPAERHIINMRFADTAAPDIGLPEQYIARLDRSGFFEATEISSDDLKRNEMYKANAERKKQMEAYADYDEYLRSLAMTAQIGPFSPMYMSRIAQLTNKSNQFNLTTKRCSLADIESYAGDPRYITLSGKLLDRFGDNGVVSVVFGHVGEDDGTAFHIDCWLMSCRVLKRGMEYAMMDALARACMEKGVESIYGYYYPTAKNKMVKEFYGDLGFEKISEDDEGNTVWRFALGRGYQEKNSIIKVEDMNE